MTPVNLLRKLFGVYLTSIFVSSTSVCIHIITISLYIYISYKIQYIYCRLSNGLICKRKTITIICSNIYYYYYYINLSSDLTIVYYWSAITYHNIGNVCIHSNIYLLNICYLNINIFLESGIMFQYFNMFIL